jgi:hypothetical protein
MMVVAGCVDGVSFGACGGVVRGGWKVIWRCAEGAGGAGGVRECAGGVRELRDVLEMQGIPRQGYRG